MPDGDHVDARLTAAMQDVPVPDGLAAAAGRLAADATASRRRWLLIGGGLLAAAAGLLLAVWLAPPAEERFSEQLVLDEAIRWFDAAAQRPGRLLSEKAAPEAYPASQMVLCPGGTRWRPLDDFLGRGGVIYDLPGPAGVRAALYVVEQEADGLAMSPALRPVHDRRLLCRGLAGGGLALRPCGPRRHGGLPGLSEPAQKPRGVITGVINTVGVAVELPPEQDVPEGVFHAHPVHVSSLWDDHRRGRPVRRPERSLRQLRKDGLDSAARGVPPLPAREAAEAGPWRGNDSLIVAAVALPVLLVVRGHSGGPVAAGGASGPRSGPADAVHQQPETDRPGDAQLPPGVRLFPPAFIPDKNGKPMHSWRVLILPYLEGQGLYCAIPLR